MLNIRGYYSKWGSPYLVTASLAEVNHMFLRHILELYQQDTLWLNKCPSMRPSHQSWHDRLICHPVSCSLPCKLIAFLLWVLGRGLSTPQLPYCSVPPLRVQFYGGSDAVQGSNILQSIFSCDQAGTLLSVRPSICPSVSLSVCLSITRFSLCSSHCIIMKFSGVITIDKNDVHAKGQYQRSKAKVADVKTIFAPIWAFLNRNSSSNLQMARKWCTQLEVA